MSKHPENNILPPFRFKIVQQYRDCLSRQIGEAMRIFYSKDSLLNSKNEYLQNCISRITINEESWERKTRERREEEEERLEEEKMAEFRREKLTVSDSVAGQSDQQRDGPHSQDEDNYNVKSAFGQSDQQRDGLPSLSNISSQEEA